jgi:hypothetical protein
MKTFEILYQAAGAGTGKTVQFDVYKPDKSLDITQSGVGTEVGTTGRYHKSLDVDAPGWFVEISDDAGGKAVKHIGQEKYDAHGLEGGIGAVLTAVGDIQTAIADLNTAVGNLNTAVGAVDGKVDAVGAGVGDLQTSVTALAAVLATMDIKIDGLVAPPMVG